MQISKLEGRVYEELRKNNLEVFRIKDICLLLGFSKTKAYNVVKSLKKKGIIKNVGKGFLTFKGINELVIGTTIVHPSYISFWTALNYYGFSDQMPKDIFLATTKYSPKVRNFKYVLLSKKRFFGYKPAGGITIAEKEKAIVDSLLFPKYSGGIKEIIRCVKSGFNEIDFDRLVEYAFRVESKAVLRRAGFVLEEVGYKGKLVDKIRKKIGKGYELLDPSLRRKNNLNEKWLLDINL